MTTRLYYDASSQTTFDAEVIARRLVAGRPAVVLDQTVFYPASGGQPADRGTLNGRSVLDVIDEDDGIVHVLDGELEADRVHGVIDWTCRFDHMQHHTGQHILSESFIKVLDAQTASFHLGEDVATIDLTREPGTPDEWEAVERMANEVIVQNRPVRVYWADGQTVPHLGLRKVPERAGPLRIVEIDGFDRTACGGTHCASTGQVGWVQIRSRRPRRVHGGLYRVEFLCGRRSFVDYGRKLALVGDLTAALGVGEADLVPAVARLLDERKHLHKRLDETNEKLLDVQAADLLARAPVAHGVKIIAMVMPGMEHDALKRLAQRLVALDRCVVLLGGGTAKPQLLFARSDGLDWHMGDLMHGAAGLIGGKGGGGAEMAMGGGPDVPALETAIRWARGQVESGVRGSTRFT